MINAEIDPRDLREFQVAMRGLHPRKLFKGEWLPFVRAVSVETGHYPPDFPGNTYSRTGNLGRNWRYAVLSPLSAEVGNAAIYAGYVHGQEQVSVHASHGWRRLFEIGDKRLAAFIEKIAAKVSRLWS